VFAVFRQFTPPVQGLSLHEAYLDVTQSQTPLGDPVSIARRIKGLIRERTGLAASVGVAPNRLVAKIASDLDKPDGPTVVAPRAYPSPARPAARASPAGSRSQEGRTGRGSRHHHTRGTATRQRHPAVTPLFGRQSKRLRERAPGLDGCPMIADWDKKSIRAEETFGDDVADRPKLQSELARLADRATTRLSRKQLVAHCVTVKVRGHNFDTFARQRRLEPVTHDSRMIANAAAAPEASRFESTVAASARSSAQQPSRARAKSGKPPQPFVPETRADVHVKSK